MIFVGVDIGSKGAVAAISPNDARVWPMPPAPAAQRLGLLFRELRDTRQVALVVIERLTGFPRWTSAAAIQAIAAGPALFEGLCSGTGLAYQFVSPQEWQAAMLPKRVKKAGPDEDAQRERRRELKENALAAAQRLFPGVSLLPTERSKVPSDGCAEALLLAAYARQLHSGGELFAQRSA